MKNKFINFIDTLEAFLFMSAVAASLITYIVVG